MKHFTANLISLLPFIVASIAMMLSIGSYELQREAMGCIIAAILLYAPCQWFAAVLWGRS